MKRWYRSLFFLLFCVSLWLVCADTAAAESSGVYDTYGMLSEQEEAQLNEEISDIRSTYQFDTALLITRDIWNEDEYRSYAAAFMQSHEIGYGEEKNGMCLLHQPEDRSVTIVFRGPYQEIFDAGVQDVMLDHCTEKLKEGETFAAYSAILEDLEKGLDRAVKGKKIRPMDLSGSSLLWEFLKWMAVSFAVMAVPTGLMTWYQKHRMKTIVPEPNANHYIQEEVRLRVKEDYFVRTVTTRTPLPKPEDSPGGHSGSFQSGGESFSGSSRKY